MNDLIASCTKCDLRSKCNQVVQALPANGPTEVMIVGECPKGEEDLMGEPFVSREGVHLSNLLTKAELDVHMTLAVKCWPHSKKVTADQIRACKPWLWHDIKTLAPKIIVTLGNVPTALLLKLPKTFRIGDYAGKPIQATFGLIVPWYSANWILVHGKAADAATLELFRRIKTKEIYEDVPQEAL